MLAAFRKNPTLAFFISKQPLALTQQALVAMFSIVMQKAVRDRYEMQRLP